MHDTYWVLVAGLILNAVITIIGTTWRVSNKLRDHEAKAAQVMSDHQIADNLMFATIRSEVVETGEHVRREVGEANSALRQKMHDMETWNRDTFIRRQSFYEVNKEMSKDIKELIAKVTRIEATQNGHRD